MQFIVPVIEMKILKLALDDLRTLFANKPPEITPTLHINIVKHIFVGRIRVYNILCFNLAGPIAKFFARFPTAVLQLRTHKITSDSI